MSQWHLGCSRICPIDRANELVKTSGQSTVKHVAASAQKRCQNSLEASLSYKKVEFWPQQEQQAIRAAECIGFSFSYHMLTEHLNRLYVKEL